MHRIVSRREILPRSLGFLQSIQSTAAASRQNGHTPIVIVNFWLFCGDSSISAARKLADAGLFLVVTGSLERLQTSRSAYRLNCRSEIFYRLMKCRRRTFARVMSEPDDPTL